MKQFIPNILTISRIIATPILVGCFFARSELFNWIAFILFFLACITDFLDGYLARQYGKISKFGQFLDPIADKILVSCTILMLAGFQYIHDLHLIPAIIILCREILVSGMREFMSRIHIPMPVSNMAKIKTTLQMLSISLIMLGLCKSCFLNYGIALLWGASLLTLITGYKYAKICMTHLNE